MYCISYNQPHSNTKCLVLYSEFSYRGVALRTPDYCH